ncbi:hypothetical protein [Pseudoroseomonas sp. WGS1072]
MMSMLLRAGLTAAVFLLGLHLLGLAPVGGGSKGPSPLIATKS